MLKSPAFGGCMESINQTMLCKSKGARIPKVGIGMPVYNGEPFVRKALDSLLAQTFIDFELIISDNASTDATGRICQEYAAKDARITYIRQSLNMGPAANFQFVLDQARGEFFMWAAADDMWRKDCLEKLVEVLESDNEIVLAFSNVLACYYYKGISKKVFINSSVSDTKRGRILINMIYPGTHLIYGMFRKENLKKVENIDWYDFYFIYYMSLLGKIVIVPDFLFYSGQYYEKNRLKQLSVITGKKISVNSFFRLTFLLFKEHFTGLTRLFLNILLIRQFLMINKVLWQNRL